MTYEISRFRTAIRSLKSLRDEFKRLKNDKYTILTQEQIEKLECRIHEIEDAIKVLENYKEVEK